MSRQIDVLIVKPGSQKQLYGELNAFELTAIEPPLWGAMLAGYLRNKGYSVVMLDAELEGLTYLATAEAISEMRPLLTVIVVSGTNPSASTMNMTGAGKIAEYLREISPGLQVLFHGIHPSALPERTLREESIDFVCQGEGFYTLPDLIEALKACDFQPNIAGLWYLKDGKVVAGLRPPVFPDLDELPMPAWDLLDMTKYRAHNWHCLKNIHDRQPYAVISTNLGCPFNCAFCCINAIFGRPGIRHRSPEKVIEEIDFLVENYGIRNIKIADELFALKESHVSRICDLIVERGHDLNIWAYARVDTINEKMLEKMKNAGIDWVAYGFESGSKKVLKGVTKGYDLDKLWSVVEMTYKAGLHIGANFIFGLPDDDFDSMRATLDLAKQINAEWANFYATMAYPGSRLYQSAIEKGWPLPESWQGYSPYAYETLPLPTECLSGPEVLKFRDDAFKEYYTNPAYIGKIEKTFGKDAADHIREMTANDLKRKHTPN